MQPENLERAIVDAGSQDNVADDPDLPDWIGDALLMVQFGYDEQQVENMSMGVKIRLMFVFTEIEKRKAAEAKHPPPPTVPTPPQVVR